MAVGVEARIAALDWSRLEDSLDALGHARAPGLLSATECAELVDLWGEPRFRTHVDMARHRFGEGEYRYFSNPLPGLVHELRAAVYPQLAPIANRWNAALGRSAAYPDTLTRYLERCHAQGQQRPTPLLLHYTEGGYNCLHQDLYGDESFPLQAALLLSQPGKDFSGGEFLLLEQRARAQSRGEALCLEQGELLIFPNAVRPTQGVRGTVRLTLRHGVSRVRSGERFALGLIFHDAR